MSASPEMTKALTFYKTNARGISFLDVSVEAGGRYPLGFGISAAADANPHLPGRNGLIDIEVRGIDVTSRAFFRRLQPP